MAHRDMISNEKYVGDCLFQKTYSDSSFIRHHNHGEITQYLVRDHHEALISREDFNAVQKLIHQRATEKGITKGASKYQNRYAFSGKIICGECGNTFKRRMHSGSGHKYIAWCCSTHLQDTNKCHMLFIRDDALKRAFVTMLNKLIFSHAIILKPYVKAITESPSDDSLKRIQELHTLLAQNTEKREILTKLLSQGIIDSIIYNKETNDLLFQSDNYRAEIESLKHTVSDSIRLVTETAILLRFAEKATIVTTFDEKLFQKFVDRIIVHSRNKVCFELKCGLTLTERMQ